VRKREEGNFLHRYGGSLPGKEFVRHSDKEFMQFLFIAMSSPTDTKDVTDAIDATDATDAIDTKDSQCYML
jgi:hypothetical protein